MSVQHDAITDPNIHEPKGAATASANTVYVADGAGSGAWGQLDENSLDTASIYADIQTDIDAGSITIPGRHFMTVVIDDISTADSVIVPLIPYQGKSQSP